MQTTFVLGINFSEAAIVMNTCPAFSTPVRETMITYDPAVQYELRVAAIKFTMFVCLFRNAAPLSIFLATAFAFLNPACDLLYTDFAVLAAF